MAIPTGEIIDNREEVERKIASSKGVAYMFIEHGACAMSQFDVDGSLKCLIDTTFGYSRLSGVKLKFDTEGGRYCCVDDGYTLYLISKNGKIRCTNRLFGYPVSQNIPSIQQVIDDSEYWTTRQSDPTSDLNWLYNDFQSANLFRNSFQREIASEQTHSDVIGLNKEYSLGLPNTLAYTFTIGSYTRNVLALPTNQWGYDITRSNYARRNGSYGFFLYKNDFSALNPSNFGKDMKWIESFSTLSEQNGFDYYSNLFYYYNGSGGQYSQTAPLVDREMEYTSNNPLFSPHRNNMLACNMLVCTGENGLEDAMEYINNGTIPEDSYIYVVGDEDKTQSTEKTESTNDDEHNENGEKTGDYPATPITENSENILGNLKSRYYVCTKNEIDRIISSLWQGLNWSQSLFNNYTGLYDNLSEMVISLHWIPISVSNDEFGTLGQITTRVGAYDLLLDKDNEYSTFTTPYLLNYPSRKDGMWVRPQLIANFEIVGKYDSYLDFEPWTNMQLYLPFVGFVALSTNMYMEEKKSSHIKVYVRTDVITGDISYFIYKNDTMVQIEKGNCRIDIPVSVKQSRSIEQSFADAFANSVNANVTSFASPLKSSGATKTTSVSKDFASGVGSNALNVANDIVNGLDFEQPQPITKGNASTTSNLYFMSHTALYISRPIYNRPKKYAEKFGFPSNKQGVVKNAIGYNEVNAPQIRKWSKAMTDDEINEIYSILSNGFIVRSE